MKNIASEVPGKPGVIKLSRAQLDYFRPHRYPMVMLEEVTECCLQEKWLTGLKAVRADDPYVQAHFPGDSSMPASFVVECLAQAAGGLMNMIYYYDQGVRLSEIDTEDLSKLPRPPFNVLAEAKVKQFDMARPGEALILKAKVLLQRKDIIAFQVDASVNQRRIASGEVMLAYPLYTPIAEIPLEEFAESLDATR
jgi:3-hydroxymyristoyl/3-hydroxydecanoyl-(acyl carrier protein) dehydratase